MSNMNISLPEAMKGRVEHFGLAQAEACHDLLVAGGRYCASCARGIGASLHLIDCVEEPALISKVLAHVQAREELDGQAARWTSQSAGRGGVLGLATGKRMVDVEFAVTYVWRIRLPA